MARFIGKQPEATRPGAKDPQEMTLAEIRQAIQDLERETRVIEARVSAPDDAPSGPDAPHNPLSDKGD
jgi:hypothetical protein